MKHSDQAGQSYEQYLERLTGGFWNYAEQESLVGLDLLDRAEPSKTRPPVFQKSEAWRNLLLPGDHDQAVNSEIIGAIPLVERHRHFGSMRSSQALAQSVFGSIAALGKIGHLAGVMSDEGPPAFSGISSDAKMTLERRVDTLGELRPTSVDVWFEAGHRIAVECKFTEPDFGTCSRPELKMGQDRNYDRDHGDGTYTRQRNRAARCSLTEVEITYWQYVPEFFHWNASIDLRPCPLRQTYQLARNVLAACVEPERPTEPDRGHALVIYDARNPAFAPGNRAHEQWSAAKRGLKRPELLLSCSWQSLVAHLAVDDELDWLVQGLRAKYGIIAAPT